MSKMVSSSGREAEPLSFSPGDRPRTGPSARAGVRCVCPRLPCSTSEPPLRLATKSGRHRSTWGGGHPRRSGIVGGRQRGDKLESGGARGKLGGRRTHGSARNATVQETDTPTISRAQEAHDIGTRGEARGWALSLLSRSAWHAAACFCRVGTVLRTDKPFVAAGGLTDGRDGNSVGGGRVATHRGARWRRHLRGYVECIQAKRGLCGGGGAAAVMSA